ncbi:2-succinyl-6-hydroxy-2,4-cyclohexadiene-1-carboxylate synthase [Virgibacillus sp. DJP39]|uniref:2-succinyl-6-hydroxy-2, 4-cyclohexadiene-1-carboxylate synthase n=1 Tax=Virgibacillus sp. DJP39 TaxID=3409790 RepID=UPI003BB5798E
MFVTVDESDYWCEVSGHGEPIMLLHGFTGSTSTWMSLASTLEKSFQVIRIDLPGHGRTKVSTPKTMTDCTRDIREILKQLGHEKIHLLGYSMGGRTALSFALSYPDCVQSLILESSSPGLEKAEERKARIKKDQQIADRINSNGIEAFVDFWQNIPLFDSQKQLPQTTQKSIREERLSQTKEGLITSLTYMGNGAQPSWWGKLHLLKLPVLLIVGEWDSKFIKINKSMKNLLPNSKLMIAEKAGHAIHVEQTDFFGKIVNEFILHKQTRNAL